MKRIRRNHQEYITEEFNPAKYQAELLNQVLPNLPDEQYQELLSMSMDDMLREIDNILASRYNIINQVFPNIEQFQKDELARLSIDDIIKTSEIIKNAPAKTSTDIVQEKIDEMVANPSYIPERNIIEETPLVDLSIAIPYFVINSIIPVEERNEREGENISISEIQVRIEMVKEVIPSLQNIENLSQQQIDLALKESFDSSIKQIQYVNPAITIEELAEIKSPLELKQVANEFISNPQKDITEIITEVKKTNAEVIDKFIESKKPLKKETYFEQLINYFYKLIYK